MKVLVISDRYPPDSVGGAEVSLKSVIDYLIANTNHQIEVISFNHKKQIEKFTLVGDKIKIHWLNPLGRNWPPHLDPKIYKRKKSLFLYNIEQFLALMQYSIFRKKGLKYAINYIKSGRKLVKMGRSLSLDYFIEKDVLENNDLKKAKDIIEEFKPDIIHADNLDSILITAYLKPSAPWTAMIRDNRFLCSLHDGAAHINKIPCQFCNFDCLEKSRLKLKSLFPMFYQNNKLRIESLSKAKLIMVTSNFLKQQITSLRIDTKITIVGNPVGDMFELSKYYGNIQQASPPEILFVGSINEIKGIYEILDILTELKEKLIDFRIVFAGEGQLCTEVENYSKKKKLRDYVQLTGYVGREELARLYARSTVVVCPTVYPEGFGRVPLEAAMFEKPVVAYYSGGLVETIVHGETGILVPLGDKLALLKAIVQLVENKKLAYSLGKAAKVHISSRFQVEDVAKRFVSAWTSIFD